MTLPSRDLQAITVSATLPPEVLQVNHIMLVSVHTLLTVTLTLQVVCDADYMAQLVKASMIATLVTQTTYLQFKRSVICLS